MRNADTSELDQLAKLWHEGWQEAHAPILPPELAQFRTLPSFRSRLEASLADVRVMGPLGAPVGFSLLKDDELNQLYVSAAARGSGAAVTILVDAEQLLAARGFGAAWLACAIGNGRAARFYEKNAWRRVGTVTIQVPAARGTLPLDVWRYEKKL